MMEPVSPELVLVDPELAARVRASPAGDRAPYASYGNGVSTHALELRLRQAVPAPGAPRATPRPGGRRGFKRLGGSLLAISLMVIGFAAAYGVSMNESEPSVVAPAEVGATVQAVGGGSRPPSARALDRHRRASVARTTARARPVAKPQRRPDSKAKRHTPAAPKGRKQAAPKGRKQAVPKRRKRAAIEAVGARQTSAEVERKLLSVIVQSPAGKLPPALINKRTGLAKNNLQAVCTRSSDSRSFLCVVKSALRPAAGRVYALYRPTQKGRGSFTWYRSRSG